MQRLRLYDIRLSRLPDRLGLCTADIPQLCTFINSAQERLITCRESGDEGWWGSWAEIAFNVSRATPYITMPREVARMEMVAVCRTPVPVNNQFFEYLQFGAGRQPRLWGHGCGFWANDVQVYSRNNVVTFQDLDTTTSPQIIRVYSSDALDSDGTHRVLIQGADANGTVVTSQDGLNRVQGIFVTIDSPFVDTPFAFSSITGIQKDVTFGQVQFFQVDPTTGAQVALHTMEPSEQTALYRRYYLGDLPCNCCHNPNILPHQVQVTALVKLELIPVTTDTDYCLIQSKEAIINECMAIRHESMDNTNSMMMADREHRQAIRLLNGQLSHYLGKDTVAVSFHPFGSARLEHQRIGLLT